MVHAFIVYCLMLNPTMCRTFEILPDDGYPIASVGECMRGGMMGSAEFTFESAQWYVKGVSCRETPPDDVASWVAKEKTRVTP